MIDKAALYLTITREMAKSDHIENTMPKILSILCDSMQLETGGLWVVNTAASILRPVTFYSRANVSDETFEFIQYSKQCTFESGTGLPGRVWKTKVPVWVENVVVDQNFPRAPQAKKAGLHAAFAFPVSFKDNVIGVLEFFMKKTRVVDKQWMDILNDISGQIGLFLEREHASRKLLQAEYIAGKAEVATSVLHNIGNVLNSINVSIGLISDKIAEAKISKVIDLTNLFLQHQHDIGDFITKNSQGQLVPQYLSTLSESWVNDKKFLLNEINSLNKNVQHIASVITAQQTLGKSGGFTDTVSIEEIVNDALYTCKATRTNLNNNIEIILDYQLNKTIVVDRTKLAQILINLIHNCMDSLSESQTENKKLILHTEKKGSDEFVIQISDNGVGISPENIDKIFSYGFTTKKSGHGFGLYLSAISADEMGGSLSVKSEGIGKGATFTLILPVSEKK